MTERKDSEGCEMLSRLAFTSEMSGSLINYFLVVGTAGQQCDLTIYHLCVSRRTVVLNRYFFY